MWPAGDHLSIQRDVECLKNRAPTRRYHACVLFVCYAACSSGGKNGGKEINVFSFMGFFTLAELIFSIGHDFFEGPECPTLFPSWP